MCSLPASEPVANMCFSVGCTASARTSPLCPYAIGCAPFTSSISQMSHRCVPSITSDECLWQSSARMGGGVLLSSPVSDRVVCGMHLNEAERVAPVSAAVAHQRTFPSPPPVTSVSPSSRIIIARTPERVKSPPESAGIRGPLPCASSTRTQFKPFLPVFQSNTSPSRVPVTRMAPPFRAWSSPRGGSHAVDMMSVGRSVGENLPISPTPCFPSLP
mmetsp:Transcript_10166/g.42738  ORF Transcript_10166/g.42738 Transcript_10166/m.42738 type:complete len:216 (+) Transcript_10166:3083-3730(+)